MSDSLKMARHSVEKRFCDKCHREVSMNEISIQQTIVVNDGEVVQIVDKLLHKACGGIVSSLKLSYSG